MLIFIHSLYTDIKGQVKIHEKKYQELQAAYQRAQTSPKDILNIPLNDVTVTKTVYITTSKPSLPIETCTQLVTDIVTYTTVAPTVTQTSTQLVTAVVTVTPSIQMAPSLQPKVSPTSPQPQASTDSPQPQITPSSPKPQVVTETATVTVTSTVPQTVIVTKSKSLWSAVSSMESPSG